MVTVVVAAVVVTGGVAASLIGAGIAANSGLAVAGVGGLAVAATTAAEVIPAALVIGAAAGAGAGASVAYNEATKPPETLAQSDGKRRGYRGKDGGWIEKGPRTYNPGPNDTTGGKTLDEALDEAKAKVHVPSGQLKPNKWVLGEDNQWHVVEWKGPGGEEISIDQAHTQEDPTWPHVGWKDAAGTKGHVEVDETPGYNRDSDYVVTTEPSGVVINPIAAPSNPLSW